MEGAEYNSNFTRARSKRVFGERPEFLNDREFSTEEEKTTSMHEQPPLEPKFQLLQDTYESIVNSIEEALEHVYDRSPATIEVPPPTKKSTEDQCRRPRSGTKWLAAKPAITHALPTTYLTPNSIDGTPNANPPDTSALPALPTTYPTPQLNALSQGAVGEVVNQNQDAPCEYAPSVSALIDSQRCAQGKLQRFQEKFAKFKEEEKIDKYDLTLLKDRIIEELYFLISEVTKIDANLEIIRQNYDNKNFDAICLVSEGMKKCISEYKLLLNEIDVIRNDKTISNRSHLVLKKCIHDFWEEIGKNCSGISSLKNMLDEMLREESAVPVIDHEFLAAVKDIEVFFKQRFAVTLYINKFKTSEKLTLDGIINFISDRRLKDEIIEKFLGHRENINFFAYKVGEEVNSWSAVANKILDLCSGLQLENSIHHKFANKFIECARDVSVEEHEKAKQIQKIVREKYPLSY